MEKKIRDLTRLMSNIQLKSGNCDERYKKNKFSSDDNFSLIKMLQIYKVIMVTRLVLMRAKYSIHNSPKINVCIYFTLLVE